MSTWFANLGKRLTRSENPFSLNALRDFFVEAPYCLSSGRTIELLQRFVLVRMAIVSILLAAGTWEVLHYGAEGWSMGVVFSAIGLIYGLSLLNMLALGRLKHHRRVGHCQLAFDVLISTAAVYATNSTTSISLYLLVIAAAALAFGRNGAVIFAAFSGICYAVLAGGLLPPLYGEVYQASTQDILGVYISLVGVALVSGYLARQLEIAAFAADSSARSLDELSKKQDQLFNDISDGVITLDLTETITGINEAARAIVGLSNLDPAAFIGKPLHQVFKEHGVVGLDEFAPLPLGEKTSRELTISDRKSDREVHLQYTVKNLRDSSGAEAGKLLIFNDISRVKSIEEQLQLHERMTKLLADTKNLPAGSIRGADIDMIGESAVMKRVFALIERVSKSDASVLITGESGTGKELVAQAIHLRGARRSKQFLAINCGAIPENLIESELFGHKKGAFTGAVGDNPGLFRQAEGGTVFLDEIGELPLHLQAKLLRVLQDKAVRAVGDTRDIPIDVRIIAATNRDLKREVQNGNFREDLFYRLNVVNILLPPLRERREDIPVLVGHFISAFTKNDDDLPQISPDALQLLTQHSFPGNVRELENIIQRALVLGGSAITPDHLPDEVLLGSKTANGGQGYNGKHQPAPDRPTEITILPIDLEQTLAELEMRYLHSALERSGGVKKHAAELLGLNFRSFRYRLKKYGMADSADADGD